jgi:hypothetical protein
MSLTARNWLVSVLVILAIIGFAAICCIAFYQTLAQNAAPKFSEPFVYVANILAGLVGGIVAVGFGVTPPTGVKGLLSRNMVALGSFIVENQPPARGSALASAGAPRELIGAIYALVYILAGVIAIGIWLYDDKTPDLVKNLATVSIGMFVAIITAFFRDPN